MIEHAVRRDGMVKGLSCLATGSSIQQARDDVFATLDLLVMDFDSGSLSSHPASALGYFAAMCLRDRVVAHGNTAYCPLR